GWGLRSRSKVTSAAVAIEVAVSSTQTASEHEALIIVVPPVGWVERSETHQLQIAFQCDGFRHSASTTRVNALTAQPILRTNYTGFSPRIVTRRSRRRSSGLKSVRACSVQRLSPIKMSPGRQTCS